MYLLGFLECFCACAVNIFLLISGFFLVESDNRSYGKAFLLVIQVIVFREVGYILTSIVNQEPLTIYNLVGNLLPSNYFIILYLSVYFISPYLNRVLMNISREDRKQMLIITLSIFVIWSYGADCIGTFIGPGHIVDGLNSVSREGSQAGYTFVNFLCMYIIGAYINLNKCNLRSIHATVGMVISLAFIFPFYFFEYNRNIEACVDENMVSTNYNSPFVIIIAVCLFQLFRNVNFTSQTINKLSKAAFTCYLAQNSFFQFLHIDYFVNQTAYLLAIHLVISVTGIYAVSYVLHLVYIFITRKSAERLGNKYIKYWKKQ